MSKMEALKYNGVSWEVNDDLQFLWITKGCVPLLEATPPKQTDLGFQ